MKEALKIVICWLFFIRRDYDLKGFESQLDTPFNVYATKNEGKKEIKEGRIALVVVVVVVVVVVDGEREIWEGGRR